MSDKNFKVKNGIDVGGTVTATSFVGSGAGLTGISSYSAPTLGSTSIASGATVTEIDGITLDDPIIKLPESLASGTGSISEINSTGSYGMLSANGRSFIRLPNTGNISSMPMNASLSMSIYIQTCNNGVCAGAGSGNLYESGFLVAPYDGSKIEIQYVGYDFDQSPPLQPGQTRDVFISFSWEGSEPVTNMVSSDLRKSIANSAGSFQSQINTLNNTIPSQAGNSNKYLRTNGSATSWTELPLPALNVVFGMI
jgi:hypothetical protein